MMPLSEQIAAVKQVAAEKRGMGEVELADALQAALATLAHRAATAGPVSPAAELPSSNPPPLTLYKQFEAEYHAFCLDQTGMKGKMDGGQGRALNDIINYLLANSHTRNAEGALKSWKFLLSHWHQVGDFLGRQKTLTAINKYLVELLETVRKANYGKKKAVNPATVAQRKKLQGELDDTLNSIRFLESTTPYDGVELHLQQARDRAKELQAALRLAA